MADLRPIFRFPAFLHCGASFFPPCPRPTWPPLLRYRPIVYGQVYHSELGLRSWITIHSLSSSFCSPASFRPRSSNLHSLSLLPCLLHSSRNQPVFPSFEPKTLIPGSSSVLVLCRNRFSVGDEMIDPVRRAFKPL
jgi:hypothetical protein